MEAPLIVLMAANQEGVAAQMAADRYVLTEAALLVLMEIALLVLMEIVNHACARMEAPLIVLMAANQEGVAAQMVADRYVLMETDLYVHNGWQVMLALWTNGYVALVIDVLNLAIVDSVVSTCMVTSSIASN
jgi:hypothetical protein